MALDRQRILSELGSVMNQLQSADCGCMNKLFTGSGQEQPCGQRMGAPLPTCGGCRRGWCQGHGCGGGSGYAATCAGGGGGGFGAPCAGGGCFGAPCAGGSGGFGMPCGGDAGGSHRPCMGGAYNAPKLYADTYSYLNQNLMQPVVKEVYDDLRSMTPANTVAMNPLANQMGLQGQGNSGNNAMQGNQMSGNGMDGMGGMPAGNAMGNPQGQMDMNPSSMGNMGAQIVNMMMSGGGGRPKNMPEAQEGQLKESMLIDAPHSPHGAVGVTPLNQSMGINAGQYGVENMGMSRIGQGNYNANPGQTAGNMGAQMMNPVTQYVTQDNMYNAQINPTAATGNVAQNMNPGSQNNMAQNMNSGLPNMNPGSQQPASGFMNPNPAVQQMAKTQNNPYGHHTPGVKKFNEMFPGLMQGGDLGFDPMAIAIQMNPANQKRAAMDTMNKLMSGKSLAGNTNMTQPAMGGQTNVNQYNQQQNLMQNQIPQNAVPTNQISNQQVSQSQQNVAPTGHVGNQQLMQEQQQSADRNIAAVAQPNQQVYTALTGAPTMNQQQMQGQQAQQIIDPNTGAAMNPLAGYGDPAGNPNAQMQESAPATDNAPPSEQQMYKEPIWPAEPTRTSRYMTPTSQLKQQIYYNTLGQPVQMLPGNIYHRPEPSLPQTLSPQPKSSRLRNDIGRFNVKATMSRTSIMGNKPVGRTPSKSQLQQIYQQYKGSQSYTQQNLTNPRHGVTHSDGRLNPPTYEKPKQQIPVERVGGDNSVNNPAQHQMVNKVDQIMGQIGDVPTGNKPHGDGRTEKAAQITGKRGRNGLQDMVYTSAPANVSWTFHGDGNPPLCYYRGNRR